jgi:hypothetical protein
MDCLGQSLGIFQWVEIEATHRGGVSEVTDRVEGKTGHFKYCGLSILGMQSSPAVQEYLRTLRIWGIRDHLFVTFFQFVKIPSALGARSTSSSSSPDFAAISAAYLVENFALDLKVFPGIVSQMDFHRPQIFILSLRWSTPLPSLDVEELSLGLHEKHCPRLPSRAAGMYHVCPLPGVVW